jgi:hypothetical protein
VEAAMHATPHAIREIRIIDAEYELPPTVPVAVLRALDRVRKTRLIDMYDRERVITQAREMRMHDPARWLAANRHLYFIALREADARIAAPSLN